MKVAFSCFMIAFKLSLDNATLTTCQMEWGGRVGGTPILLTLHVHRSRNLPEKFKAAARKRLIDHKHQIRHLQIQKLKPLKEKWFAQDHIVNQWQSEG